jgi:DNA-binding NarL/FixJ family response regulator
LPKVLLADGDVLTRAGVRDVLRRGGFEVCAEAGDTAEAVECAVRVQPDLCVIDVELPGGGIAAAGQITGHLPGIHVVMLTLSRDEEDLFASLRAGASGYLPKDADPARLPQALQGVLNGEAALPRELTARLIKEFRRPGDRHFRLPGGRPVELTPREVEVLDLLRRGMATAEAAEALAISEVTVRRHISGLLKKLDVPDRESALRLLDG